jgi:hypothetical protein
MTGQNGINRAAGAGAALRMCTPIDPRYGIMAPMTESFALRVGACEWLIGPPFDPYGDGYIQEAEVELRADGLTARTAVVLLGRSGNADLDSFFATLVADWRGWEGERHWEALEHQMSVDAWHDGRANVNLAVTLRRAELVKEIWSARAVLAVEAGEQLATVANDLAHLLAP